jgi:outer membrane protein assembly factor BamB
MAFGDDWPGWLGPERDGVWRETGIVRALPPEGPVVRWRHAIGSGYAGPAVAGNRVYVLDRVTDLESEAHTPQDGHYKGRKGDGFERVLCLDNSDGRVVWTHAYACRYSIAYPSGPRATPIVDNGKVYTLGTQGNLFCLDAQTGRVIWQCDFTEAFGLKIPTWGVSAQPLIDGDKLICIVGGQGTTAVAFNKNTGEELWRSLSSNDPGYSAPVIIRAGGVSQLIVWHGEAINALNPETGTVYWTLPIEIWSGMAIVTPKHYEDSLFVMGFRGYSNLIALDSESPSAASVWQGDEDTGVAGTMNTPHIEGGYLYAQDHDGMYRCIRLDTGERVWEDPRPASGSKARRWANVFTVKNGDRYFLMNDIGDLIIAKMSPDGYEEISRSRILDASKQLDMRNVIWSHPAFANRSIYARNDHEIVCLSLEDK